MPSIKRYRLVALATLLILLTIYYVTHGARNTVDSPFYRRTVAAIQHGRDTEARQRMLDQEKEGAERRERVRKEHDAATAAAAQAAGLAAIVPTTTTPLFPAATDEIVKPAGAAIAAGLPAEAVPNPGPGGAQVVEKLEAVPIAGKPADDRVVQGKPSTDTKDGVAKMGNVEAARDSSHLELEQILAQAPLVIFSKSYCPYSKKAKHVLLDLYTIIPTPLVIELDLHDHGASLQRALDETTHRSTVPNVLVNAKSIGGGDDIVSLHESGELIKTITTLGGTNISSMKLNPANA